jgi:hypothetical protein
MTWARPVILLVQAWRRKRRATPCPPAPPAREPLLEQHPDENGHRTEALILDLSRAMDAPEDRGPLSSG